MNTTAPATVEVPPPMATAEERAYYALNRSVYAWFAPFYDALVRPLRRMRRTVVEMARVPPDARVLDVATGTGEQALAFAAAAAEVIGVDLSESMLAVARRKRRPPNVSFLSADAISLPFPSSRFDVTCVSFALHEMPLSVRARVVREMARVTRRGGTVVVVDYALPRGRIAGALSFRLVRLYERDHYAEFVRSDVRGLLEGVGIAVRDERRAILGNVRLIVGDKVS